MKNFKKLIACLMTVSVFFLAGCQEGPAEKQGKKIDNTVENIKDKIQNKGPAQKAGEKLDDMTGNNN
ncbi:Uncharacterised protein [Legionella beliardensis]|uniref:Lipoprotein n=1 Tax=Legionella beliardensis TaxID=91822 RepID=A0A378I839_9GAMM|nr:hypothetical protein [Legionella beliardensis]STX28554.1 Uncharacterised protein [Legionella beliardensis]